ncbi:hypothetical protein [Deinococcus maricopensis]|uniref:Contractile injection system tube protein N-terminal domain-containing protein n=1 Tax=Deinococcus maricopensis (strain DSM 21211 / LMG 22137 / NRRL B-23946 / LB-34) TaxID=709986 RepID=E8U3P4_DEIML|nr:hypothetical protein [Deinococcus maricopensis]ADV68668.1 hypothetical protein Deima_3039 [Deinococcus maricopensis DSM 21211]
MSDGHLVKAKIRRLEPYSEEIECMFNPREYTITKANNWGKDPNSRENTENITFQGGGTAQLTLELFFDTYLNQKTPSDVRQHTDRLWRLMEIIKPPGASNIDKGRPPKVLFQWGNTWHFNAVILSMEQQFTLFMPDGMPVRATVKVQLQQTDHETLKPGGGDRTSVISNAVRASGQTGDGRKLPQFKGLPSK